MRQALGGLLAALIVLAGLALPSGAQAGHSYGLLSEPWVKAGSEGDSIEVYGAVFNGYGSGASMPKADRVTLEQRVVEDGVAAWVERDSQKLSFVKRKDQMDLTLSWLVPPDLTAARIRSVIYSAGKPILYSGWNRLGLSHLTAEKLAEDGCAIKEGGQVFCWPVGYMIYPGATYRRKTLTAVPVGGLARVKQRAGHCVLRYSGQVFCWGDNDEQIVGDGSMPPTSRNRPTRIPGMSEVESISSSGSVTCAVKVAGPVWCWGASYFGSLGTGMLESRTRWRPQRVKGLSHPRMISTAGYGSCAVTSEAKLACWGPGKKDRLAPTPFSGLENVTEVGVGDGTGCALDDSGQVYCWGENDVGQLGDGTRRNRPLPVPIPGLDDAVDISIGGIGSCAIREGGQVVCWGYNYDDRMGVGLDRLVVDTPHEVPGLDDAAEIYTDGGTHCAIRSNSEVWCWGYDTYGSVGNGYPGGTEFLSAEFPVPVRSG